MDKFNCDTYDQAVRTYLKWKAESLPIIKCGDSAAEQHKCIRLQVFTLLRKYDPDHPIFEMLKTD